MEKATKNLELISKYFAGLTPEQISQFRALDELYKDWNKKINLISRKDIDSLYEKHVLHSLSIAAVSSWQHGMEVIDIGTGGGFPGIPLAIFFPGVQFHLVDSIGKKIKAVQSISGELDLKNVSTQHIRAEEIKSRRFDTVVSRAVAPLKQLLTWSKPLVKKKAFEGKVFRSDLNHHISENLFPTNGLICLKGGDLAEEISESNSRPLSIEIYQMFKEEYFREKFVLFVGF